MRIRTVKKEDFLEIMDLASKCDPIPVERDSIYHLFTKYFTNTCFVAEKDNKIVGYILGFISQLEKNVAYIHNICISPDFRRKKIGSSLYQKFFQNMKKEKCQKIFLIINPTNKLSISYHESLGFNVSKEGEEIYVEGIRASKNYNGPGKHMVVMCKSL
ncbi:MAG: GNAT family N-acetyltransferase [Candidatus Bathyarchaeota archaeon]|nr:GNAT family N-acetyltransferase [Candidatus Bathyarchaeota archaeon]